MRHSRSPWLEPLSLFGLVLLAVLVLAAVFAGQLAPHDPLAQAAARLQPPSAQHWFGTDQLGRDVLSRVIFGARLSLPLAVLLVVLASVIGVLAGALAGYYGGWLDSVVMRTADLVLAFPPIILAMVVVATLGPSLLNAVLAVVVVSWPIYARVVRSLILTARQEAYVDASWLVGSSALRTLWRDIRPTFVGPMLVLSAIEVGQAVLVLAGLSFLGLGAQPPAAEWGAMVSEGARHFDKWWIATFPGLAIFLVVLATNLVGDTLRDVSDPRTLKGVRA